VGYLPHTLTGGHEQVRSRSTLGADFVKAGKALAAVDGATAEHVQIGEATVAFDPARTNVGALIDAAADAGYGAQQVT
jgi:copper chaperone CopZ